MRRRSSLEISCKSERGEYIGQGKDYQSPSRDDLKLGVMTTVKDGVMNSVEFAVENTKVSSSWWRFEFAAPKGAALRRGEYANATRFSFNSGEEAGLDISGPGRGSNKIFGKFTVEKIRFNRAGDKIVEFCATFEQHSERPNAPALTGTISYFEPKNITPRKKS